MKKNGKILEKMTKNENFQINEKKWKFSNKWEKMRKMRKNDDLTACSWTFIDNLCIFCLVMTEFENWIFDRNA